MHLSRCNDLIRTQDRFINWGLTAEEIEAQINVHRDAMVELGHAQPAHDHLQANYYRLSSWIHGWTDASLLDLEAVLKQLERGITTLGAQLEARRVLLREAFGETVSYVREHHPDTPADHVYMLQEIDQRYVAKAQHYARNGPYLLELDLRPYVIDPPPVLAQLKAAYPSLNDAELANVDPWRFWDSDTLTAPGRNPPASESSHGPRLPRRRGPRQ
ncbi:uncharacterized protein PFL1_06094 [Pseudozyma flocculosa PF-1]|nr:uncharacterized protein PFL1_06094 [Pseudozyma flocculosa PF-1]EPQ26446.1 hypothetical protein PFL1_06094 [Pseudozyma flocculosa PF-1]